MVEKLRLFLGGLLFLLKDNRGTVASMVPMTGDTTSDPTSLDYARPEIWEQRLRFNAARKSFFGPLKGKELSGKPIIEREDFVNQAGDVIHNVSHLKNLENCWNTLRAIAPIYGKMQWIGQSADKGTKIWMN